ncbi:hypothetical protein GCE9029_00812 [Grimontia celer]|uniref:Uncharacterized protein n=1 Tax=Grimontia celer TaxID=1796497 RepID=A0A128EUZ3_9GAMM|nr:hypothetical protein [Grimontia celer]CZF78398.1 hypothetical protein GCE9029_00812 [Grimontia celer]
MRFIVTFTSIIFAFGVNASELEILVDKYVAANLSFNCEQIAQLVHPDDLSFYKKKVDNSLKSSNKDMVEENLLPLLGVNTRQQAIKLGAEEAYTNICTNLIAKLPTKNLEIANPEIEYLRKTNHGDTMVVTYKVMYELGGISTQNIFQHGFKKYKDNWRVLLTPEALAYFAQYN